MESKLFFASDRDRRFKPGQDLPALLFITLIFTGFFYPALFEGKTFFFRDILHFSYPMKHFIWKNFQEGILPLWWPEIYSGIPFQPLLQPGVFYPVSLFFFMKDISLAYNLFFLSQHFILMVSVYFLVRYWGLSSWAGTFASVASLLGGYFLSIAAIHNHFQSAVWMPLIFIFFQKYLTQGQVRYFILTVLFITVQTLGGSPENCLLTIVLVYAHSIFTVKSERFGIIGKTVALAGATLLALGLSAVQLFPTYFVLEQATRGEGMPIEQATRWSLDARVLATIILPEKWVMFMAGSSISNNMSYFFPSLYMGLIPIFFLFTGFFLCRRREALFWVIVFWTGIFLAMGKYNPVYEFLFNWVPLFDMFRYPQKFLFLSAFALVFLVGYGMDYLTLMIRRNELSIKILLIMVAGMSVLMFLAGYWGTDSEISGGLLFLLLFGFLVAGTIHKLFRPSTFQFLALIFFVTELWMRNSVLSPMITKEFFTQPPEITKKIPKEEDLYRLYTGNLYEKRLQSKIRFPREKNLLFVHLAVKDRLYPNFGTIYGFSYVDGLAGLRMKYSDLWDQVMRKSPVDRRVRILQRSNVKYHVTSKFETLPTKEIPLGMRKVELIEDPLPRAFLVGKIGLGKNPYLMDKYYDESFDPSKEAIFSEPVEWQETKNFSGTAEIIDYYSNGVKVRTRQNGKGFLILLDTYFPGWSAKVDGRDEKIYRANYFYRAVPLEPGEHVVEFSYKPVGFRAGIITSIGAFLVFIMTIVWLHRRGGERIR